MPLDSSQSGALLLYNEIKLKVMFFGLLKSVFKWEKKNGMRQLVNLFYVLIERFLFVLICFMFYVYDMIYCDYREVFPSQTRYGVVFLLSTGSKIPEWIENKSSY